MTSPVPLAVRIALATLSIAAGLLAGAAGAVAAPMLGARSGVGALTLTLSTGAPATGGPAPVSRIAFTLSPGIRIGAARPSCSRDTVERSPQKCPPASRVGSGSARWAGYNPYTPAIGRRIDPTSDISIFSGTAGTVILRLPVARPIPQVIVLTGSIETVDATRRLIIAVPLTLVAGYDLTPVYLQLRLGGRSASGYVRRSGTCPKTGLAFGVELRYRPRGDGPALRPQRASATAPC